MMKITKQTNKEITHINELLCAGSGYELYNPYPGNVTVLVGPAPHYGGPGGGPPVLAAVPCQPLPLQPLEWFNPAFLPYVTAPCHNGLATARDRRKRYSTDSQVFSVCSLSFRIHKMTDVSVGTSIFQHCSLECVWFSRDVHKAESNLNKPLVPGSIPVGNILIRGIFLNSGFYISIYNFRY
jgi:hypothetical protein